MRTGECLCSGAPDTCRTCGVKLKLEVLKSHAGYYIGTRCDCGPHTRESGYFTYRDDAWERLVWHGWEDRAGNFRQPLSEVTP